MADRRTWTAEQDETLKHLKRTLCIKKWSVISKILESEYRIMERNDKQCRERYNNHLLQSINFMELSLQEQEKLFRLHNRIGNKWPCISEEFEGMTENQIKNHFHSKLRKGIRKLNKEIKLYFKNSTKESYKLNIVYKIVEASDLRFGTKTCLNGDNLQFFNDVKNCLLEYAGGKVQSVSQISCLTKKQRALTLISMIQSYLTHLGCNRQAHFEEKTNKKSQKAKTLKKSRENSETQNSHASERSRGSKIVEKAKQSSSTYQENSFQQISHEDETIESSKATHQELMNQPEASSDHDELKGKQISLKRTFLQNQQILQSLKIEAKEQAIINSLVEDQEFPLDLFRKKSVFNEFNCLKEFEDSYLDHSEISGMMKRFDDGQEVEPPFLE